MERHLIKYSGLELITEEDQSDRYINLGLFVRCGTAFENSRCYGITNLCSRIIIRRLNAANGGTLLTELRTVGADFDVRVDCDLTAFLVSVKPHDFCKAVDILFSIFEDFPFTERDVTAEKAIAKMQAQLHERSFEDEANASFFGCNVYKLSSVGDQSTILKLKKADIEAWKNNYFISNNSCIVMTGCYSRDDFKYINAKGQEIIRKKKTVNTFDVPLPEEQYFRKLGSDKIVQTNSEICNVSIKFDLDLTENPTVYCGMLCAYLGLPYTGKLSVCLKEKYAYTDSLSVKIIMHQGFACLDISYKTLQACLADSLRKVTEVLYSVKQKADEAAMVSVMEYFKDDMLYKGLCSLERCLALGKHGFILCTDRSLIPEDEFQIDMARVFKRVVREVLSGDSMVITAECNINRNSEYLDIMEAMAQLRVRLML